MGGRWRAASLFVRHISKASKTFAHCPSRPSIDLHLSSLPKNPRNHFLYTSLFSAVPSPLLVDSSDFDFDENHGFANEEDEEIGKIPVKAYFLCTSINLKNMQAENLSYLVPPTSRSSSNYIALRYNDFPSETSELGVKKNMSCCRYMIVFQYGSAVLFNVEEDEVETYLGIVRRHSSGLLSEMRKDDYAVKENPLLPKDMHGGPDHIVLKSLDTDGVRIIGSVLGQSIALDYFVSQVDSIVEEFADINRRMEKTGTFTMDKKKLLQLVGKANSNLADLILKVGLFERSEIAWRDAKYAQIHDYLREEYEVTQRFGNLDLKLKFVENNIHFLHEVIQNRKSDLLDRCIIGLLTIENAVSLYEIILDSQTESQISWIGASWLNSLSTKFFY